MQVPTKNTTLFNETKPAAIRIWHWLVFLFFTASITTVIFGSTLFKTSNTIGLVQEQVQQGGGTITPKQARSVAHEFSDQLWMLHKYIGFGLSFLMLWRIVAEFAIAKDKKLYPRLKQSIAIPNGTDDKNHYVMVQYLYILFYVLFLLMTLTGLVLAFEDVEWLKPVHKVSKQIHSLVQWGLYAYIIIHITGVIMADLTKYNGIVSRMINGKKS